MADLVEELLPCPVCRIGRLKFDDGQPDSPMPAPPGYFCHDCGSIIPQTALAPRAATALDRPVDGEREELAKWYDSYAKAHKAVGDPDHAVFTKTAALLRTPPAEPSEATPEELNRIKATVEECAAERAACGWRPCTGCHETNEGHSTGDYYFSNIFGCEQGAGCSECGGLGVTWEYYDAATLREMQKETALIAARVTGRPGVDGVLEALKGFDDDYMTSEQHNPGYVLIPTAKFEQIRAAIAKLLEPSA